MIHDARQYNGDSLEADICVIGAGPAGLTIARHFANSRHRLVLVESGDVKLRPWAQKLSRGTNSGHPYEPLHLCRVRRFGGTTGPAGWGGWCKPLAEEDFAPRALPGVNGWPIARSDMQPFYEKAAKTLGVQSDYRWGTSRLGQDESAALLSEPVALTPFPDFGTAAYEELATAPNVDVLVNATAVKLSHGENSAEIGTLQLKTRGNGTLSVRASYFVVACGGIENARLLLASNDRYPNGLGNDHDLVGRFFMEHPHVRWGHFQVDQLSDLIRLHNPREAQKSAAAGIISPTCQPPIAGVVIDPAVQAREGILRSRSWIKPTGPAGFGAGTQALQDLTFWFRKGRTSANILRDSAIVMRNLPEVALTLQTRLLPRAAGPVFFSFDTIMEQQPDPQNRVTLDRRTDAFGSPRARLNVKLDELVEKTFRRTQEIITAEMAKLGVVRSPSAAANALEKLDINKRVRWVRHHMGTTRMGQDAKSGVVDANCKVHGVPNLFVAGSSVFPTGGNDMPTMTIVALAHRLADHLTVLL